MNKPTIVSCPTCHKTIEWSEEAKWRPFCCHRCRLIDLGEWVDGNRRIPGEEPAPINDGPSDDYLKH